MPALDDFDAHSKSLGGPLTSALEVTPDNAADLPNVSRSLFVGVGGDLRVLMLDGQTVTYGGLGPGWHPIRVSRVLATGTTASAIVACW
jgi:hypothetical protein|tara:strand:- start:5431 stop:5697 length:267 start_codon:yes stop_codon:yes gene_type:complete